MTELAGVMVGNYFLLECMEREGIVETYRARPTTRGGYDVLLRLFQPKFPDPTAFREHFATEVEKVWHCHHDHIQPLLEFGSGEELLYSVTMLPEEETLAQLLERRLDTCSSLQRDFVSSAPSSLAPNESPRLIASNAEDRVQGGAQFLPLPLVLRFVTQLCAALQYTHEQGIVHGNVQPASILVRNEQDILLTNFSMKRAYQEGEPVVAQVQESNPSYSAPEQVAGMLCPASDIYAVGVLLYRLLAGRLPYEGESAGEIALKHANEPIPSLRELRPELPEELELVVRVALAKSPAARFSTAADLAQALLIAVSPDASQVISFMPERRIPVRSRRTPFTWTRALTLLIISVLLFGLGGTLFFVTTLPQHLGDLPGLSFLNVGQYGTFGNAPGVTSKSVHATPTVPSANAAPIPGGRVPTAGTGSKGSGSPTAHPTPTPVVNGTVPPGATPTPNPAPTICTSGIVSIDGSPYLQPLLQQMDSDYLAQCPGVSISQYADGSGVALAYLQAGQLDVAASDLTANPALKLNDHPLAAFLYVVIVSPDVQLTGLSRSAIQEIYAGQITNWSQLGGPYEPITIIYSPAGTAINAIFRAYMLNGSAFHAKGIRLKRDLPNLAVQAVSQIPGAISVVPLVATFQTNVQVLAIDGVSPNTQAMQRGTYPFWSVEHLYTQGNGTAQAQALIQFFNSAHEATIMSQLGAVSISLMQQNVLQNHLPGPEIR